MTDIWTAQTAVMRGTAQVSSSPLPSLAPCSLAAHAGALLEMSPFPPNIPDLSASVQLSKLPPHPFITSWDKLPSSFYADNLSSSEDGSLRHRKKKNHFRMDRSKAVYFTWPTGEARVSHSALLCKVTLGGWHVPCCHPWLCHAGPWWPCGGSGTEPTLG